MGKNAQVALTQAALLLAVGCGRIGFDPQGVADDGALFDDDAGRLDCVNSAASCPPDHFCDTVFGCTPALGIYRSVGPGSTALLASGADHTLTIKDSIATFDSGLPSRVGVGDALEFDSNGDAVADSIVFLRHRISESQFALADENGNPTSASLADLTSWTLHRAYLSIVDAADGAPNPSIAVAFDGSGANDLLSLGMPWHIACYGDAPDLARAQFLGWTTSADRYLRIFTPKYPTEVGASQRHEGRWTAERYHIVTPGIGTNDIAIESTDMDIRVIGLQIFVDGDGEINDRQYGVNLSQQSPARQSYIGNNIIRSSDFPMNPGLPRGIKADATGFGATVFIWNNVIYNFGGDDEARGIELTGDGMTAYLYNNTIANVYPAIFANNDLDTMVMRNNVVIQCASPANCTGFKGTKTGSNNHGEGFTGLGTPLPTDQVTDYFVGADDYRLNSDATHVGELQDQGVDLSADSNLPFSLDLRGAPRVAPWDVGAFEQNAP